MCSAGRADLPRSKSCQAPCMYGCLYICTSLPSSGVLWGVGGGGPGDTLHHMQSEEHLAAI